MEKRLKAILAFNEVDFKRTHNISYLTTLLEQADVNLPACRDQIETLTPWAGDARYEDFFAGTLDRPSVPGVVNVVAGWSSELLGTTDWLSATVRLLQGFAGEGTYDHLALLVEREREAFVLHTTLDRSVWGGAVDELGVELAVKALDREDREVISVSPQAHAKTMGDGLALLAMGTLEGLGAKQVLLLVRSGEDFSFMWWHVTPTRTLTGDGPPNSLSGLLLDLDQIAAQPMSSSEFDKPDPDVRFSAGAVYLMTEDEREAMEHQFESFRKKFGRDPKPEDPVFFNPEADEPELMPKEKFDRIAALAEEFGSTEYGKRIAAAKVRAGMVTTADSEEPAPYDVINPVPMLLVLTETTEIEGDLQARCLYAAVHAWAEGHLAAPQHPKPIATETPLHAPPFPDPQEDVEQLAAVVAVASQEFDDDDSEIAAITLAAGLAWRLGCRQGLECKGCAIEGADRPFARAMREGQVSIGFQPIIRTKDLDTSS